MTNPACCGENTFCGMGPALHSEQDARSLHCPALTILVGNVYCSCMTPRAAFALAVRIIGLISLLYAINFLFFSFASIYAVIRAVLWIAVSVWLLRGAPQLVSFAYRDGE